MRVCRRPRVPLAPSVGLDHSPRTRPGERPPLEACPRARGISTRATSAWRFPAPSTGWLHVPTSKPVFFIHDMLPFETPEYFRASEFARHQNRMHNLARHGAGAIVSTEIVKAALQAHLVRLGRRDLPILTAPPPVAPIFMGELPPDEELSARPFFVQCGTIEPRKNHLTILHVWRELVARHGRCAPKLLLVGSQGLGKRKYPRSSRSFLSLRDHVLEVSGLPTPFSGACWQAPGRC